MKKEIHDEQNHDVKTKIKESPITFGISTASLQLKSHPTVTNNISLTYINISINGSETVLNSYSETKINLQSENKGNN